MFGYGCNLGPNQTARHAPEIATAQALRRINSQHINAEKLEAAMVDVIGEYVRFQLPRHCGSGRTAIADGTHVKLRENNLLGSRHIRYGGYGGIAYHHIADTCSVHELGSGDLPYLSRLDTAVNPGNALQNGRTDRMLGPHYSVPDRRRRSGGRHGYRLDNEGI